MGNKNLTVGKSYEVFIGSSPSAIGIILPSYEEFDAIKHEVLKVHEKLEKENAKKVKRELNNARLRHKRWEEKHPRVIETEEERRTRYFLKIVSDKGVVIGQQARSPRGIGIVKKIDTEKERVILQISGRSKGQAFALSDISTIV